ncbi:MAG: HPr(Ser) kinase/phosphatase [Defluviitaleaceae bacterium]|nr:HPr(Ser) kinase/phosphatase [Defluviitaleaceae bacterium]
MINIPEPSQAEPVPLAKMVSRFSLQSLTPGTDIHKTFLSVPNISRPGLQLAGFYDRFNNEYVQMLGRNEMYYLASLSTEQRNASLEKLFASGIPCVVITHGMDLLDEISIHATVSNVPVYSTKLPSSEFSSEVLRWLKMELAPSITLHGVLLDIYGEGVIIMGESGVGKSETALQLIKLGHRLIADDAVEVRRIATGTLMGTCPSVIQYFTEIRGIGIIDIKQMFGVEAIKTSQVVDLVLYLEHFDEKKAYDRMGHESHTIDILGQQVSHVTIPIRPGRNLAVICEAAAVNHRQKKMGYNAAEELNKRMRALFSNEEN